VRVCASESVRESESVCERECVRARVCECVRECVWERESVREWASERVCESARESERGSAQAGAALNRSVDGCNDVRREIPSSCLLLSSLELSDTQVYEP